MTLTILVADDDLAIRVLIGAYLELLGYCVIDAENGQEALKLVEEYQPNLIVTDILMPKMDGYEFIRCVRTRPAFRLIPVILLTGHTSLEERIRGYQTGCDNFLPKPFDLQELGVIIRSLLDRYVLIAQALPQHISTNDFGEAENNPNLDPRSRYPVSSIESAISDSRAINASIVARLGLTEREKDVLNLLSDGLSNAKIGESLHLSPRTVEKYVSSLLRKTESNNRAELVRFALEHDLIVSRSN
jgi:DNA-binding NarL/FixJ family response regulator